jgi:glycosyltransferase involved in cell wall biosynthesis
MVHTLQLGHRIEFANFSNSVENIWLQNHVLLLPSRYEGMPLALVEAMLCGRPALVTDVAGNAELIEDGITGFVADAPAAASVRAALERLWGRRADLQGIGRAAAKKIRKLVPADPAGEFVEKLKDLVRLIRRE